MFEFLGRLVVSKIAVVVAVFLGVVAGLMVESAGFPNAAVLAGLSVGVVVVLVTFNRIWSD